MKSFIPSLIAIFAFITYFVMLLVEPESKIDSLANLFKASLFCWPVIMISGLIAMILGYKEAKKDKRVYIWIIPVSIIFAIPVIMIFFWIT